LGVQSIIQLLESLDNFAAKGNMSEFRNIYEKLMLYIEFEKDKKNLINEACIGFHEKYKRMPDSYVIQKLKTDKRFS
jgi:hypothetical protein